MELSAELISSIKNAVVGGILIGVAVSIMLIFNGRVTGIAGIVSGAITFPKKDMAWRVAFILGLVAAGAIFYQINPEYFKNESGRSLPVVIIAGLLVGFGTVLGSGCTSGHGVCGISRVSVRSLSATIAFIVAGFLTASLFRLFFLS